MKDIDWSKAPEGAEYAGFNSQGNLVWFKNIKTGSYEFAQDGIRFHGWGNNIGDPPCAIKLIARPTKSQGPQDELPPVGATHEDADLFGLGYSKPKYEVVAHHYNGVTAIVSVQTEDGIQYRPAKAPHFRPIQSERDKAVSELEQTIYKDHWVGMPTPKGIAETVWGLGWRKPMSREDAEKILCSIASDRNNGDLRFSVRQLILNELGFKD